MPPILKVTIVGAGVAGLTAAIALSRQGHSVNVYERRKNTNEQSGSGVQIQPTGVQILRNWGLGEGLRGVAHESGEIKLRRYETGEVIATQSRRGLRGQWWGLRNDVRRFLYESAITSGAVVYFERRAKSVDLETASVTFENGEVVEADLLIGADGTNSAVRATMHPTAKAKILDQCVFQSLIPREIMYQNQDTRELYDDPATHLWLGQDHFGLSSVAPAQNVYDIQMIFLNYTDKDDRNPKQLLEPLEEATFVNNKISNWNPVVKSLFKNAEKHLKWRVVEAPYLDTAISNSGKVVLIGDAYHGMVPHAGEGSSMGIEDAAVLAELLSHALSAEDIPRLMRCYNQARHARVTAVRQYSDFVGKMFSYPDGKKQQMRDKILRTYDPNQYPDSIPSMTARYGSAEWMTWLDVFDVKETVRNALENADKGKARL